MTKREIVCSVVEKLNLTQLQKKDIVQNVFDCLVETLVTEGQIELRNFGVFEVRKRAARKARNPRTGEKVLVKEKHVVVFKSGKHWKIPCERNRKNHPRKPYISRLRIPHDGVKYFCAFSVLSSVKGVTLNDLCSFLAKDSLLFCGPCMLLLY